MKTALLLVVAVLTALAGVIPPAAVAEAPRQESACDAPWLALALPAQRDVPAALEAVYYLRARNQRALILARPDADEDTLRILFAEGHQLALLLDPAGDIEAQVAAWEATMVDLVGHPGLKLAHLPEEADAETARAALEPVGYRLLIDEPAGCDAAPEVVTVTLGDGAEGAIYNHLAGGASMHPAARWLFTDAPATFTTPSPEAFKAAHVVVIDPGHTRMDRGASIQGADGGYQSEQWSNVVRGRALRSDLRAQGWTAVMTTDDGWLFENPYNGVDMDSDGIVNNHDTLIFRANFAYYVALRTGRRAVILMLHADSAGDPTVAGYSLFYPDPYETADDSASFRLAQVMGDHLAEAWARMGVSPTNRGIHPGRTYGRERGPRRDHGHHRLAVPRAAGGAP
ncbi:MAG: N-acetylmuramoyl-L-alanine amidase [Anaerolineae bacterium]|nr:N-acetylmuramoyl-L-alanine amidase [Anaerolineae bacterium]